MRLCYWQKIIEEGGVSMEALWFLIGFTVTTVIIVIAEKIINK